MAKKLDSPCMFCGGIPCTCGGGTTKKSSKRTVKASSRTARTTTQTSQPSTPGDSATDEDAFSEHQTVTSKFSGVTGETEQDLSHLSALRVLRTSGILTPQSERSIDNDLSKYPQDVDRRVHGWMAKHPR